MKLLNRYIILCILILQPSAFLCAGSGENAALSYYQAFLLLPEEDEKLFENWSEVPKGQATEDILNEAREALWFFHRGAKRKECDWGIATEEGWFATTPYGLNDYTRRVTNLVCLHARSRTGKNDIAAVQDIIDLLVFARHVENGLYVISKQYQVAIDKRAISTAAVLLQRLTKPAIKSLRKGLESLPPVTSGEEVWKQEKDLTVTWLGQNFANCKNLEKRISHYRQLYLGKDPRSSARLEAVFKLAHNRQAFNRKLKDAIDLWKKERLLYENWKSRRNLQEAAWQLYERWSKNEIAEAFSHDPYSAAPFWESWDEGQLQLSLFRAAIDVSLHGKKSIADKRDPIMGKPLHYEKTERGFVISSEKFPSWKERLNGGVEWWQLVLRVGKRAGIEKRLARTKAKLGADNEGAESES